MEVDHVAHHLGMVAGCSYGVGRSKMKDYSKMSDFEVNGYVSMYEHGFSWIEFDDEMASHVKCGNEGSPGFAIVEVKDYCNNPSDAWSVIHENRISLRPDDMYEEAPHSGYWRADNETGNHCHHENPLRAAMIVYLMMKDGEK